MKRLGIVFGVLVGLFLVMQVVRPDHTNPPVTGDLQASAEVKAVLKRACYDCHSNETKWPWYSNVAPVSFLIANHVKEGRGELNFSVWSEYAPKKQAHKMEEIEELVREGEMPMPGYVAMHAEAKLTDAEKTALQAWAKDTKAAIEAPPPAPVEPALEAAADAGSTP